MRNSHARALRAISCFAPAWGLRRAQAPHQSWQGRWLQARAETTPEQGQRTLVLPTVMVPLACPGFPLVPPA